MTGKQIRLSRVFGSRGRTVIVPIDQSITSGPIQGLSNMGRTIERIVSGEPNAVLMHRGPVSAGLWRPSTDTGLIVHLSGSTQLSDKPQIKATVCGVEEALRLGADAVSVHISLGLGNDCDNRALVDMGRASDACAKWNVPLLAMMYVYGEGHRNNANSLTHAARVGSEMGADMIKISYTGDPQSFADLVESSYTPILVAGGETGDGLQILQQVEIAMAAGAAGVCVGRNVYQHAHPTLVVRALNAVVHDGVSAEEAFERFLASRPSFVDEAEDDDERVFEFARGLIKSA